MNLKTIVESFLSCQRRLASRSFKYWMPAFAGMTSKACIVVSFFLLMTLFNTLTLAQSIVETEKRYTLTDKAETNLPLPTEVEVFFDRETLIPEYAFPPGQAIPITYHNLSPLREVNPKINEELTKLKLSQEAMEKMLSDTIGKGQPIFGVDAVGDAKKAYDGAKKLESYRITKLPAIVFDGGKSAVLGVREVGDALRRYGEWRKGRD